MADTFPGPAVRIEATADRLLNLLNRPGVEITPGTVSQIGANLWGLFGYASEEAIAAMSGEGYHVERIGPHDEQPWERAEALRQPPTSLIAVTAPRGVFDRINSLAGVRFFDHGVQELADGRIQLPAEATDQGIAALRQGGCEVVVQQTAAQRTERLRDIYSAFAERDRKGGG